MSEFSWREKLVAIAPKPFASMSIVGSLYIISHVLAKPKRRGAAFHRILLGLSVYDLLSSVAFFLGTWPIPRGSPGIYLASGNDGTCSAQGFFVQLTVGTPLYNASLATYYFFVVSLGWKEHQVKRVEPALHLVPILFSLGTAIAAAATDSYRDSGTWCWIDSSKNAFRLGFLYVPIWCAIVLVTALMAAMYCRIVAQERRMQRYSQPERVSPSPEAPDRASQLARRPSSRTRKASRAVAAQGAFYVFTFLLAWIFPSWTRISQMVHGSYPFPAMVLMTVFTPWQGFLNCLVYFRPRFLKYRQRHPELNIFQVIFGGITTRFEFLTPSSHVPADKESAAGDTEQHVVPAGSENV